MRCIRCRCRFDPVDGLSEMIMTRIAPCVIAALALGLAACTNPYDPVQRGLGGGLLGAASGAAIGGAAGGGPGAALGAAIGGATGIFGGVATTPPPPPGTYYATQPTDIPLTDIRATHSRALGTPPTRAMGIRVMDTLATMHITLTNRLCDG